MIKLKKIIFDIIKYLKLMLNFDNLNYDFKNTGPAETKTTNILKEQF